MTDQPEGRSANPGQLPSPAVRAFNWLFRNRQTGAITIGQFPNIPLAIFLVALVLGWLLDAMHAGSATLRLVIDVIGTGALLWWAGDELIRGVNPWRRIVGGVVIIFVVAGLIWRG